MLSLAIMAILADKLMFFFGRLADAPGWMAGCYLAALTSAALGTVLVFRAKLPLYRQRRFCTFGSKALPESRRPLYRRGYCCFAFALVLLLGLGVLWR